MSIICLTGLLMVFEPTNAHGVQHSDFFLKAMRLHRWLYDVPAVKGAMTVGKMIVAISTVCMAVTVITGIILWWKRANRSLSANLKITCNRGFGTFCRTLHTNGGIYVALFLLVIALTGLTWSFGWYREIFNACFGIEKGSHIIYSIHTGSYGGITTRIIWFISVLVGFTLPLSGYYLWFKRRPKHKKIDQNQS